MTISYKGAVVFVERTVTVTSSKPAPWEMGKEKNTISLIPDRDNSSNDTVVIMSRRIMPYGTFKGQQIKDSKICRNFGIGWYK